ncbi:phenylalanine--tRNA ligase subunit alpha [Halocatena salina]|uniref:Phenylalanine--tRNA ligase alpha subunit n=1 Tax=Halocatena salina TaxID=2934340 RepID=A0A8T9ZZJ5_9EURY|nr:phenylalanine--tRNA ligase subunit alpha [Halocatena salina]UPM41869.1 phenylalanine--tRNA ligase subunit alpha [Halocatena salina]
MKLPRTQVAVLETASATEPRSISAIAVETDENETAITRAAFELADAGLLDVTEETTESVTLTEEGEQYAEYKLPEVRLYRAAIEHGAEETPTSIGELLDPADLDGSAVEIALSNFARKGYGEIENGSVSVDPDQDPDSDAEAAALSAIDSDSDVGISTDVLAALERRELLVREETTTRSVTLTDDGVTALMEGIEVADTVGQLTPELLASGEWQDVDFAEYNVEADTETIHGGRTHVLRRIANRVKRVLVGMGFNEMDGPHVDADFWINDALFMPQDHPARTHWGRFALSDPDRIDDLPDELVDRVRSAHRTGVGEESEGYHSPWDEDFARELALRGHTTSLSMRYLAGEAAGDFEPPQRYFSVEKAYRNDTLDATHLLEFFQIEGLVMAEKLSVRDLMGTFTEFYRQFGITDIRFKPHYNPYTEPSFELFGRHPTTGELIEIGNSGLFRPEVLEPLGVDCDVMAWGLALERLAMLITGAEDIRDLHGTLTDLEFLRTAEVTY